MAAPRVFISSTYYDLKYVRDDLASFIRSLGYDAVMHDRGNVVYSQEKTLEQSCYDELSSCDIVICVIGNKYGTQSGNSDNSITMEELQCAIQHKKKIYVYIVNDVYIENNIYLKNKDSGKFSPNYVDNIKIHEFIADLKNKVHNNPIIPFNTVSEIIENLRAQFAGLFQRLIASASAATEARTYYDLQALTTEIRTSFQINERKQEELYYKINTSFLFPSAVLSELFDILELKKTRFVFDDFGGLCETLELIGYNLDTDASIENEYIFIKYSNIKKHTIKIAFELFNENNSLKRIYKSKDVKNKITYFVEDIIKPDDDLPF